MKWDPVVQWLWPFDGRFKTVDHLPDLHQGPARMRNRWRLHELVPFIQRWGLVLVALGLLLYVAEHALQGPVGLFLRVLIFTAWWAAFCFTGFLVWLHAQRPR